MVLQPDGKVVVGGYFNGLGGGTGATVRNYLGRINGDGTVDAGFNPGATFYVDALALQADGAIVVGGDFIGLGLGTGAISRSNIGRVDADGVVDPGFNPGAEAQVNSLEVQVDGKIVAGGYFKWVGAAGGASRSVRNYIARIDPNGVVDPTFNPGADNVINAVAVQADGAIITAGIALSVGGLQGNGILTVRNRIARFAATDAAVQTLTFTGGGSLPTNMAWARSGGGPEVSRVTFAFSFDGSFYSEIGAGTRVAGGWVLNNAVNLPLTRTVWYRAQGFYGTGFQSGSGSIVESVVVSSPTLPTMTLGSSALRYRAVTSGSAFLYQTGTQVVTLTQSGPGAVSWTATSSAGWIQVSPASGSGPANLQIAIVPSGLPAIGTLTGSITFTFTGAANNPGPITVGLNLVPSTGSDYPFGIVDTPTDNRTGVTGAIPFTGWLLDDVDVAQVMICRFGVRCRSRPGRSELRRRGPDLRRLRHVHRRRAAGRRGGVPQLSRQLQGRLGLHGPDQHAAQPGERRVFLHASMGGTWTAIPWSSARRTMTCGNAARDAAIRRDRHADAGRHRRRRPAT